MCRRAAIYTSSFCDMILDTARTYAGAPKTAVASQRVVLKPYPNGPTVKPGAEGGCLHLDHLGAAAMRGRPSTSDCRQSDHRVQGVGSSAAPHPGGMGWQMTGSTKSPGRGRPLGSPRGHQQRGAGEEAQCSGGSQVYHACQCVLPCHVSVHCRAGLAASAGPDEPNRPALLGSWQQRP